MADPNEKNSDFDDLFSSSESEQDVFASSELTPDLDVDASSSVSEGNPFGMDASLPLPESELGLDSNADAVAIDDKKGKKGKKEKKAKKAPKVSLGKKEKSKPKREKLEPENIDKPASVAAMVMFFAFLFFIVACNAFAFMTAGAASIIFLILFDLLGVILLVVPLMLKNAIRKGEGSLFTTFLAFAAAFAIISCMIILALQASTYGQAIKAAFDAAISVQTMIC